MLACAPSTVLRLDGAARVRRVYQAASRNAPPASTIGRLDAERERVVGAGADVVYLDTPPLMGGSRHRGQGGAQLTGPAPAPQQGAGRRQDVRKC